MNGSKVWSAFLFLVCLVTAGPLAAGGMLQVDRWHLHSSFWINLHEALMQEASTRQSAFGDGRLSAEETAAWTTAITAYRTAAGDGSITFSNAMMQVQDALTQVADDAVVVPLSGPLGDALQAAAPVYRAHRWPADAAANRFLMGYAAAMLREVGEELIAAHEKVYGVKFPPKIRVDISGWAGQFGAYTHDLQHGGDVVTIASRDSGNHGLTALELIVHESSHSVVGPRYGSIASAIAAASKKADRAIPRDLWHAVLFATSSELTRRVLAARGAGAYVPLSSDLLTRAWPHYRSPIETHWYPYLNGSGTLQEAIDRVVAASP